MFCPECGKSNPDGLKNCQHCNAELIDNSPHPIPGVDVTKYVGKIKSVNYRSFFQLLNKKKKIIIPIGVVLIVVIAFFCVAGALSSPERLVKSYLECYIDQDYQKMYSYISVSENDFINQETFEKYMSEASGLDASRITNYNVSPLSMGMNSEDESTNRSSQLLKSYVVSYVIDGSNYEQSFVVNLVKQSGKNWLFFDKYKIALRDATRKDYTIFAPSDLSVEVDGITIKGTPLKDSPNESYYTIDSIFGGNHTIKISGAMINEINDEVYIASDNSDSSYSDYSDYYGSNSYDVKYFDFEINDTECQNLIENAQTLPNTIYGGAISGKTADQLGIAISTTNDDFANLYNNISNNVKNPSYGMKSISFSNFRSDFDNDLQFTSDGFRYSFILIFDSDYVQNDYFTNQPVNRKATDCRANVSYYYEDGSWKLASLSIYGL